MKSNEREREIERGEVGLIKVVTYPQKALIDILSFFMKSRVGDLGGVWEHGGGYQK